MMIGVIYRPLFDTVKLLAQLGVGSPTACNADLGITTTVSTGMLSRVTHCVHLGKCRQLHSMERHDAIQNRSCHCVPQVPSG